MGSRFAIFGPAHLGGINSFCARLTAGLAPHGIELHRIGVLDRKPLHGSPEGTLINRADLGDRQLSEALYQTVMEGGYDGAIFNILVEPYTANLARYLPSGMAKILVLHGITTGMYSWARAIRDWLHHTVVIAPRMRSDLTGRWGFDPGRMSLIPHGIGAPFGGGDRAASEGPLRVLVASRLADADKGCLWIPGILAAVRDLPVELTVAGDGADRSRLEHRLAAAPCKVTFTGAVPQQVLADLYRGHDVLLLPSRTEGFALSLLEAMASGCVPVASRIKGVTDAAVTDGRDGYLFAIGDTATAAACLRRLAGDRQLLRRLSAAAMETAATRFALGDQMAAYAELLAGLGRSLPPAAPPERMEKWTMASGFKPRLRSHVPAPLRIWLRTAAERLR
ncbi:MAG: glycosyltransferase family 4 protein [Sphingomonadales bacterium]